MGARSRLWTHSRIRIHKGQNSGVEFGRTKSEFCDVLSPKSQIPKFDCGEVRGCQPVNRASECWDPTGKRGLRGSRPACSPPRPPTSSGQDPRSAPFPCQKKKCLTFLIWPSSVDRRFFFSPLPQVSGDLLLRTGMTASCCALAHEFARLRTGLMTVLKKWSGGIRGIVVGEILRLVCRTMAQSLGSALKTATAPH